MERLTKRFWLSEVIIFLGCFGSVIKARNESTTNCECSPTWDDHWDRYIPNMSLLTATQRMVFLVDSDVDKTMTETILVAVPPTLVWKFTSKIPNLKQFASNSKFYVEMLEKKYRGLTEQGQSYFFDADIEPEVQVAETIIKEATGGVTNLVSDWRVHDIIAYNRLDQKDLSESTNYFKLKQMNTTVNHPQENLTVFADWYLPIYEKYGGNETIQRFFEVINSRYSKSNKSGLLIDKVIVSPGEFVHIWSQAANTDLRDLAYQAFGWIPEYRRQFEISRKTSLLYNYTDVYPNASLYKPPQNWIIQGRNLTLVYLNDHVAFYYDEFVSVNVTWPFNVASDSWSYVKSAYNYSGFDPILYVILQNEEEASNDLYTFSKEYSYFTKEYQNRLVLDYHTARFQLKWDETYNFVLQGLIVEGIGNAAPEVFKETGNIPLKMLSSGITEILAYDIYIGIGKIEDANRYFAEVSFIGSYTQAKIKNKWFLDWYYPIYHKYGSTAVLKRFLTSLYEFWPRKRSDYTKQLIKGEFVHFWSGATGVDLTSSAIKAFGMSPTDLAILNQARVDYPMLNYTRNNTGEMQENLTQTWEEHWGNHRQNLTLDYFDDHIAFYLDPSVNQNITWLTSFMSDGWKYAKATYGTIGQDPLLYVVLHGNSTEDDRCLVSRAETFSDPDFENRNVIDCELPPNIDNNDAMEQVEKLFVTALSDLILNSAKGVGKWPGGRLSRSSFYTIIAYDILAGIGRTETAKTWYTQKKYENTYQNFKRNKQFWFRDWYYPIYTNYGGRTALNNFLDILSTHWPHENEDYLNELNSGEWVHFWSAAVGELVLHLAFKLNGWEFYEYKEYLRAREKYPLNYSDVYLNASVVLPPETYIEKVKYPANGGSYPIMENEELELVYTDAHVAIYYDSGIDRSIIWPFKSLSAAWAHAKRSYGPFSSDPLLYVFFHNGPHVRSCSFYKMDYYEDALYENKSFISCGHSNNPWNSPERLKEVIEQVATVIRKTAKGIRYWPAQAVTLNNIQHIILYDLYKAIGMRAKAREWLEKTMWAALVGRRLMRDWYYPIYKRYGEAQVMDNFLSLLHEHFPKSPSGLNYARNLTAGEYVHFWSGATGTNLTDWAKRAGILKHEDETDFQKAKLEFPMVVYKAFDETLYEKLEAIVADENEFGHTGHIYQQYVDSNVNVYFDSDVDIAANWTFPFLSKSWQHTKSSYETVQETANPILKTVLHGKKHKGCKTVLIWGKDTVNKTTAIDCGSATIDKWLTITQENKNDLISQYTNLIQKSAQQPEDNTPYVRREFSKVISFDLFLAQEMFQEAHGILSQGYNETEVQSGANKFWVRDWFLPLYTKYGGVSVLNKFMSLLPTHWNLRGTNAGATTMNFGQLVHFWSAAAGESVLNVAQDTFGRGSLYRDKLNEAKKDFLLPFYSCNDCYYDGFEHSSSERNLITGLSLGFAGIVTAVVIILLYLYRKKVNRLQERIRELTNEEITEFFEGNSNAAGGDGNASIESKPFNKDYEISRDRLDISFDNVLGSGEFGVVLRGKIKSMSGSETVVAVKTVKPDVDVTCFKALLVELKVMCYLGKHNHIASLLGAVTVNIRSREVYIVLEFCAKGDLLKFLKNNRSNFMNLLTENKLQGPDNEKPNSPCDAVNSTTDEKLSNYIVTDTNTCSFSTFTLLEWSRQVALGMSYLASKNVIHADLAARNVLLTSENVAKISDFGLSRQLLNYSNYMKTSKTPVPWRWMAIESLRDMNFSVKSDTWAFGVTLYEIFSLGTTPYAGWTWDYEFIDKLVAGHRLSEPECGNQEIYTPMMDCMKINPEDRIEYEQLLLRLEAIINKLGEQSEDAHPLKG